MLDNPASVNPSPPPSHGLAAMAIATLRMDIRLCLNEGWTEADVYQAVTDVILEREEQHEAS